MFSLLTKYLVQYGRVCIPHIGTLEVVHQSPQLDVADKLITPPFYKTLFSDQEFISEHQLNFMAAGNGSAKKELLSFGERLKEKLKEEPVSFKGFGTLRYASNAIVFDAQAMQLSSLGNMPAQKVMRENVQHQVLVGDREMNSAQVTETLSQPGTRRSWLMIAGWILFGVSLIAIAVYLYLHKFQTTSPGLRLTI